MRLYLDDIRPCPEGWTLAKTVTEAKSLILAAGDEFEHASLDHDLGACPDCMGGRTVEQFMVDANMNAMPNCDHFGTGYNLVCWMEETGNWPKSRPTVHSANPVGRARMLHVIAKHYDGAAA